MKTEAHVIFTGRVQGVFFRQNTVNKAREMELTGWVKNLTGGQVEAVFEGEEKKVMKIVAWCRKKMPGPSRVDDLEVTYTGYRERYGDFSIRR